MNNVSLLQNGNFVCELVYSEIYPVPEAAKLVPGHELVIVTASQLEATLPDGFALGFRDGSTVPIHVVSCRVGIEGWDSAVRVGRPS